ncbi:MAG: hypothetical protein J5861_03155 [Desulfovibrio sp.]|nr:hypothetical protein [Desulfovibrio sp.]
MKLKKFALLICSLLLFGCTTARHVQMDWMFVDGGRSTGELTMAIMWNPQHDKPDIDVWQAQTQAANKCRSWGFQEAEQNGDIVTRCTRKSSGFLGTCIRKEALIRYHCTNRTQ